MARRRPSFRTYARRRWRVLGFLGVLLAGSLLVLGIIDRGHEPSWSVRTASVDAAAIDAEGEQVYLLMREEGNLTRLEARRAANGVLLWESPLEATRALIAAGREGVAVATDFPRAFLTVYAVNGSVRFQVPLEGNPRAMSMEGSRVALALQAPGNPLLVFDDGRLVRTHFFASFVKAVDMRQGRIAAGAGDGEVVLVERTGTLLLNATLPMSVRSLRLDAAGETLVVGGSGILPGDLTGSVAFLDAREETPLRWTLPLDAPVGLVALDAAGTRAMAIEEQPSQHTIHVLDAATGAQQWSRPTDGHVASDDAGASGGAALSPDGGVVVLATLRGDLIALDGADGAPRWRFDAEGVTQVLFPREAPGRVLASGRLVPAGPYGQALLLFSVHDEPLTGRLPVLALLLAGAAVAAAALILGVGYWRVRQTY